MREAPGGYQGTGTARADSEGCGEHDREAPAGGGHPQDQHNTLARRSVDQERPLGE